MPIDIVASYLVTSQMQECVVLMDDFGNSTLVSIPTSQLSSRSQLIASAQSVMAANQAAMEAYAAAVPLPLPTPLTLAQKQALYASQQTAATPNSVTVTQQS